MTSPTDPPQTLKEGRSIMIQWGGQTGARKRASAEEVWRGEEKCRHWDEPHLLSRCIPQSMRTHKKQMWVPVVGGWGEINDSRAAAAVWGTTQRFLSKTAVHAKGDSRGEFKTGGGGGGSKCHQHWLNPPPKPAGMLSTHCSICTQKKGHCRGDRKS